MPFGKAKSRKARCTEVNSLLQDPPQDEFLNYFQQYRRPNAFPQRHVQGWGNERLDRHNQGINAESEYEYGSCYSSLDRFSTMPNYSILPSPPPLPPQKRTSPMSNGSAYQSQSLAKHQLSPGLGDLSGMLAEKMSFGNDVLNRRRLVEVDDGQSRDSGHLTGSSAATNSSSDSPRLRPLEGAFNKFRDKYGKLMRRRALPQKQLSLDTAERVYNHTRRPLEWQSRNCRQYSVDDRSSMFSYNTAVEDCDSGADSVLSSYMDFNPIRGVSNRNFTTDSISEHSIHTGTLFSSMDEQEDEITAPTTWAPWMTDVRGTTPPGLRNRQTNQNPADVTKHSSDSFDESQSQNKDKVKSRPESSSSLISRVLSLTWLVVKISLSVGCCTLLCLALFVASRSLSCRWSSHQQMELSTLDAVLKSNVIGQHLAVKQIVDALGTFYNISTGNESSVLVLYLLGWLGTGKTMTSSLLQSQFPIPSNVHLFSVPVHFAPGLSSRSNLLILDDLSQHIRRSCGYSMVVFDDVDTDNMSAVVANRLSKFILSLSDSEISNGTVVVITSTAGSHEINNKLLENAAGGTDLLSLRDDVSLSDVLETLDAGASRIPLYETLKENGVMIRVAPFLPLTRDHVRQCIVRELSAAGAAVNGLEVNAVLEDLAFVTDTFPVFSKTGCKMVGSKVDLLLGNKHTFLGLG